MNTKDIANIGCPFFFPLIVIYASQSLACGLIDVSLKAQARGAESVSHHNITGVYQMPDDNVTLDKGSVQAGAKRRSRTARRNDFHQWAIKAGGGLEVIDDKGIPGIVEPESGNDPALIELRFKSVGGRHDSHLELNPQAYLIVGDQELPIDTYVEGQAWRNAKNAKAPMSNGEEFVSAECDSFAVQIVATSIMADVLGEIDPEYLASVDDKGKLVRSKATPWIATRLYRQRKSKDINLSATPMMGLENVRPTLPSGDQGYERNVLPAKVYAHAFIGDKELRAREAVETLGLDESVRDVHFRMAVTADLVQKLQEHAESLAGITYETTNTIKTVSFIS